MKKRVTALFIALTVLAQMFCLTAGATAWDETNVVMDYSMRTTELFEKLDISNFIPENSEFVSRVQFTATLMALFGYEDDTVEKSIFSDVRGDFSGILNLAAELKVVSKSDTFRPNDAITFAEALKMGLVLAGYEYECAANGGWPAGVMNVAYRIDLTENLKLSQDAALTPENAYTLLYNLMRTNVVGVHSVTKPSPEVDMTLSLTGDTVLSMYHGVYIIGGVITENSRTSLYAPKNGIRSCVEIDKKTYYSTVDAEELIGYNVIAFLKKDKNEIVAAYAEKTDVIVVDGEDVLSVTNNGIMVKTDDKKRTYPLEDNYDVLYNGKAYIQTVDKAFLEKCEYVKLIDNDRDGRSEILSLLDVSYMIVDKVNYVDKIIYTHSGAVKKIDMSNVNGQYFLYGNDFSNMSIYQLESEMMIEAVVSADGLYAVVKQSENVISGEITATAYDDLKIEISGVEYKITKDYKNAFSNLSAGTKGNFYIGQNGKIVLYQKSSSRMQYGYIIKTEPIGMRVKYQVKMLCENGKVEIFDLADKVSVDTLNKTAKEAHDLIVAHESKMVKFKLDDDKKIRVLDLAKKVDATVVRDSSQNEPNETDSLLWYFWDYTGSYWYKAAPKSLQPKVNLANTKVFAIPVNPLYLEDDTKYLVGNCSYFSNDKSMASTEVELFDVDKYGNCSVMLYKGDLLSQIVEDGQSAVIEKIRYERDEDDKYVKKLYLITGGKYVSYFMDASIDESTLKRSGKALSTGDIIRFSTQDDKVTDIAVDFDSAIDVMSADNGLTSTYLNTPTSNQKYHYQMGKLYSINDKTAYMELDSEVLTNSPLPINNRVFNFYWKDLTNYAIPKSSIVKVLIYCNENNGVLQESTREVSIADLSEVETYLEKGKDADYAVLRQNAFEGRLLVVYKFIK